MIVEIHFAFSVCPLTVSSYWCLSPGFSLSSPLFNETVFSYAVIPWPQSSRSYLSFMEFEVTFRPSMPDGTLLYSDDSGSGDFLAINLVDRYVEFRFDCGSGGATIRLQMRSPLSVSSTLSLLRIVPTRLPGLCCVCVCVWWWFVLQEWGADQHGLVAWAESVPHSKEWHPSGGRPKANGRNCWGIVFCLVYIFYFCFHIIMRRTAHWCSS